MRKVHTYSGVGAIRGIADKQPNSLKGFISSLGTEVVPTDEDEKDWKDEHNEAESKIKLDSAQLNLDQKKKFANRFVWLAIGWLIFVGIAVVFDGLKWDWFDLDDKVILMLLGTATANVLAPMIIFAKYLFGK